jgi:pSer/pThr/pTyr-binding forkhead associated (FHA) protein
MKAGEDIREIPLGSGPVVIGRAEENTVTILDPKSSRKHCTVETEGRGFVVVDHESRNGTHVNGQKITRHILREGDVIAIGSTNFIFHGDGEPGAVEEGAEPVKEKWVLEMETPEGETGSFSLEKKVTIGRNPKNTIAIKDGKASNFHCEILRDGPGYKVRDLNSTNGTRVDGKLIEELDLYHGSVISIGKTHFTIRNLALPDSDLGFDTGPIGGAEFATFSRKRRGFPISVILALAVVAGGLYVLNLLATKTVTKKGFDNPPGNLLEKNYSFEGLTDTRGFPIGYRSFQGEEDSVSVVTGGGRTGKKCLVAEKGAGEDPAGVLEVIYGEEVPVSQGKVYQLSAFLQPSDLQGVCGVKIVWLSRKDLTFRRESYSNVITGDEGDYVETCVKAPVPVGASRAEAVCFIKGRGGAVRIDDMQLREVTGDDSMTLKGARLDVRVGPRGLFSIRRSGGLRDIVHDGQLLLIGEEGKVLHRYWQRYCQMDEGYPKKAGEGIEIRGKIFDFSAGKWTGFTEVLMIKEGQVSIAYEVEVEGGGIQLAGIAFSPEREEVDEGVGIVTPTAYEMKRGGRFEMGGVVRMLWGQATNPVSFNYDPPVNCIQVREEEQVQFLQLLPRQEGSRSIKLSVEVQTDFKALDAEIREALQTAREAENNGKPGLAIERLRDVLSKYPFKKIESKSYKGPPEEKTGAEWLARLEKNAFEWAEKIRTRFEVGQFFRNLREIEASLGDATNFLEKYSGSTEAKGIEELAGQIRAAIQDQRVREGQLEAQGFLLRAREHRDRKETALAKLLYRHVSETWPGTEWAKTAEDEGKAMEGGGKEEKKEGEDKGEKEDEKEGDEKKDGEKEGEGEKKDEEEKGG